MPIYPYVGTNKSHMKYPIVSYEGDGMDYGNGTRFQ
jgi:hypothetical protein